MRHRASSKHRDFEVFMRDHRVDVTRFVIALFGHRVQVDDIVSETFITAWKNWEKRPDVAFHKSWMFSIAKHHCMNAIRSDRARVAREMRFSEDRNATAMSLGVQSHRLDNLAAALDELKPEDFDLVVMIYWDRLSHAEVAEKLGMTAESVAMRISRIRSGLGRSIIKIEGEAHE